MARPRPPPPPPTAASQVGLALTPELIATLASLRTNPPNGAAPRWQHEQNNGEAMQHHLGAAPGAGTVSLGPAAYSAPVGEREESEVDKNERYKSTLAFAANLLSQIQQQQQEQEGGHR
ncbi:hypothetical protein M569_02157 [Genlisea aurea]|uniref:Uncharacterized protein n=1 Tax=Genlisea aurea TaxID=192259 RepID=S8E9P9_9LAMI|nr:hypothetical protein M569_02157 [Genlisea aurea]